MQLLDIMQLDSVDLLSREGEQGTVGARIRKEISRRNAIGYWKGDFGKVVVKQQEEEVTNATEEKRRANRFKRGILAFPRSLFFIIHRTTTTTFNRYRRTWFGMLELGELVRLGIRRIYGR